MIDHLRGLIGCAKARMKEPPGVTRSMRSRGEGTGVTVIPIRSYCFPIMPGGSR